MAEKNFLYYVPRILAALIVAFFGMFALEVFSPEFDWGDSLSHLSLTFIVFVVAVVAWKQPKIGGWLFLVLAMFFAIFFHPLLWNGLALAAAPCVAGLLFILERPAGPEKKIY